LFSSTLTLIENDNHCQLVFWIQFPVMSSGIEN